MHDAFFSERSRARLARCAICLLLSGAGVPCFELTCDDPETMVAGGVARIERDPLLVWVA